MNHFILSVVIVMILGMSLSASEVSDQSIDSRTSRRVNLALRATAGTLLGEAGEAVSPDDGNFNDKVYFGGGISAGYVITPRVTALVGFDLLYKDIPISSASHVKVHIYSAGAILNLKTSGSSIPFLIGDLGIATASVPNRSNYDLGSNMTLRLGAGIANSGRSVIGTRFYLYYRYIVLSEQAEDRLGSYGVDSNISQFGLEFAFTVSL